MPTRRYQGGKVQDGRVLAPADLHRAYPARLLAADLDVQAKFAGVVQGLHAGSYP